MNLNQRSKSIAVLKAGGATNQQIAETLQISPATVARTLAKPLVKELTRRLEERLVEKILVELSSQYVEAASHALQALVRLAKSSDQPSLQLAAAQTILSHLPQQERSR